MIFLYFLKGEDIEISIAEIVPILQWFQWCLKKTPQKKTIWLTYQNIYWAILVIIWIRPAFLNTDILGGTFMGRTSHARQSSCTNARFFQATSSPTSPCEQNFQRDIIYNPLGVFNSPETGYDPQGIYSSCPLDQLWANATFPEEPYVKGFTKNSIGQSICGSPLEVGPIARYNCPVGSSACQNQDSYPGKWYGVKIAQSSPVNILNTEADLIQFCPGTTGQIVNLNATSTVKGRGSYVCSYCLFYLIQNNVQNFPPQMISQCLPGWSNDPTIPPNEWQGWKPGDSSWLCSLCPARGSGWWGVKEEHWDEQSIIETYWFSSTVTFFLPLLRRLLTPLVLCSCSNKKTKKHQIYPHQNDDNKKEDKKEEQKVFFVNAPKREQFKTDEEYQIAVNWYWKGNLDKKEEQL
jgi:hypothetical protein